MQNLKLKLQQLGPLRPHAWAMISQSCKQTHLKTDESFIRTTGTLAYISTGLLKEYDAQYRKSPSIINFIGHNKFLITRKHNQQHYLKACTPTLIYHWDFETLQHIYHKFAELKPTYDLLCGSYDESVGIRQLLLEERDANKKIALFIKLYPNVFHLLKKKDIANYLHLGYDYFVRNYSKHL